MPVRNAVAAGRFYPGSVASLQREITGYLEKNPGWTEPRKKAVWAVMLPHAGYMYCGDVIGKTLSDVILPKRLIILSPNHTGYGVPLSVWPTGSWATPLGRVEVDSRLASEIVATNSGFQPDLQAHMGEHSIEVLLPFIQTLVDAPQIVPITLGTGHPATLKQAAGGLASVLSLPENRNVGLIVSSDMNHYEDEKQTLLKDNLALEQILAKDPEKLLETVKSNRISMCGAAPMALALMTSRLLGDFETTLCAHDTSGAASGDHEHVVGYAGVQMFRKAN